jgi:tetratricopeptide (TPR) repeat protein
MGKHVVDDVVAWRRRTRRLCVAALIVVGFVATAAHSAKLAAAPVSTDDVAEANPAMDSAEELAKTQELQAAIARFGQRDFQGTLDALKAAVAKRPELGQPLVLRARMFLLNNDLANARGDLEAVIREAPEDPEAYLLLGDLAFTDGRFTECGLLFDKATQIVEAFDGDAKRKQKSQSRVFAGKAALAETRGDWKQAQGFLDQWLALDSQDSNAHARMGRVLFELNQPEEALKEFEIAEQNAPPERRERFTPAPVALARLYDQRKDRDKANQWKDYAVAKRGGDVKTWLALARWLWDTGRFEESRTHADKAIELDPKSVDGNLLRGVIARFEQQPADAEKFLEAAYFSSPSHFQISNQLALVLAEQADPQKKKRAGELAAVNLQRLPRSPEALATMGWVMYLAGEKGEAEKHLGRARAATGGRITPDLAFYMATVFRDKKEARLARDLVDTALKQSATVPFVYRPQAEKLLAELEQVAPKGATPAAEGETAAEGTTPDAKEEPTPQRIKPAPRSAPAPKDE